jgi:ribosome-binding protein aMBF1 (putative translation factor)
MESKKRNRGAKLREIMERISPQEEARVLKQMLVAACIADALEAKGWSNSEFAARMH